MKKFISLSLSIITIIVFSLIFTNSSCSANDEIMPLATQYIVYQYMEGNTYTTPTFTYTNMSAYLVQGQANGSNVKVYLMDAVTGKQMGETYTLKNGVHSAYNWDFSVNPDHHNFYYKFVKTNPLSFSVFLNLHVLY